MSRVTEYKVRKAIEAGAELDEHTLAVITARPQDEVRQALMVLYPEQFAIPGVHVPRLAEQRTEATLDELVAYAQPIYDQGGVDAILALEYHPSACGCMGPQRGEPLCPCSMRAALANQKLNVSILLLERLINERMNNGV